MCQAFDAASGMRRTITPVLALLVTSACSGKTATIPALVYDTQPGGGGASDAAAAPAPVPTGMLSTASRN
jgi:hypothetical protein